MHGQGISLSTGTTFIRQSAEPTDEFFTIMCLYELIDKENRFTLINLNVVLVVNSSKDRRVHPS